MDNDSKMNFGGGSNSGGGRIMCLTVLVVVCGVIAVMAVIVAAVSISRPPSSTINVGTPSSSSGSQSSQNFIPSGAVAGASVARSIGSSLQVPPQSMGIPGKRVWTIAVGHDWGVNEYIDSEGYLAGFNHDLIREVCAAAGMDCRTIWDSYNQCWDSKAGQHATGGRGLMSGLYDACVAWTVTTARIHVFAFSQPILKQAPVHFYYKTGFAFDLKKLNTYNVGFIDGYFSDEKCLARTHGVVLPIGHIKHMGTPNQLNAALQSNQIQAIFADEYSFSTYSNGTNIVKVDPGVYCSLRGNSMMTRKDNDFNSYWDQGFAKILSNGRFRQICKEAIIKHGGAVKCL